MGCEISDSNQRSFCSSDMCIDRVQLRAHRSHREDTHGDPRRGRVTASRSYSSLILQNPSITLERDIRIKLLSLCNDTMNASLCDATFQVGEDRQIFHVISALFAIHSPELNRLLTTHHHHHSKHEMIPLLDITADSFAFLRRYVYGLNSVVSLRKDISEILYASSKLKMKSLTDAIIAFIVSMESVQDLVMILCTLHQRGLHDIVSRVIEQNPIWKDTDQYALDLFQSKEQFCVLPQELMMRVISKDPMHSDIPLSEDVIFTKCILWAKYQAKCALRGDSNGDHQNHQIPRSLRDGPRASGGPGSPHSPLSPGSPRSPGSDGTAGDYSSRPLSRRMCRNPDWKSMIQPLIPYIRFPTMDRSFFAAHVIPSGLLPAEDCKSILQFMTSENEDISLHRLKYNERPREFGLTTEILYYDRQHLTQKGLIMGTSQSFTADGKRLYGYSQPLGTGLHQFFIQCTTSRDHFDDEIGIMIGSANNVTPSVKTLGSVPQTPAGALVGIQRKKQQEEAYVWAHELVQDYPKWTKRDMVLLEVDCKNWKIECFVNDQLIARGGIESNKEYFFAMGIQSNTAHFKLIDYIRTIT